MAELEPSLAMAKDWPDHTAAQRSGTSASHPWQHLERTAPLGPWITRMTDMKLLVTDSCEGRLSAEKAMEQFGEIKDHLEYTLTLLGRERARNEMASQARASLSVTAPAAS